LNILTVTGPADLPDWTVHQPGFTATATAAGGTAPYSWTATGLPSGLAMNAATGTISGTPTVWSTNNFNVTVRVTDGAGRTTTRLYSMRVNAALTFVDTTFSVRRNRSFDEDIVSGGTLPSTLTGAPSWIHFDDDGGDIFGTTPNTTGTHVFTVTVTDATGASRTATVTFQVTS
jgi:hypothetical protein